jgi:uncharacterized DUF497 family protein
MKEYRWDEEKSELLKEARGASFEDITDSRLIAILKHPSRANQRLILFDHEDYVWVVPCVVEEKYYFLKTLYPSRKYTKLFKGAGK